MYNSHAERKLYKAIKWIVCLAQQKNYSGIQLEIRIIMCMHKT